MAEEEHVGAGLAVVKAAAAEDDAEGLAEGFDKKLVEICAAYDDAHEHAAADVSGPAVYTVHTDV